MLTVEMAQRIQATLARRGVVWEPRPGDRFYMPDRDLDEAFVISDMTIEVAELPSGRLIRFNGTTEWALDSIAAAEVVWIPWEHQLRDLLGDRFDRLERLPAPAGGWAVVLSDGTRHADTDPARAYAQALLA